MAGRRTGNENNSALRAAFYRNGCCLFKVREHLNYILRKNMQINLRNICAILHNRYNDNRIRGRATGAEGADICKKPFILV